MRCGVGAGHRRLESKPRGAGGIQAGQEGARRAGPQCPLGSQLQAPAGAPGDRGTGWVRHRVLVSRGPVPAWPRRSPARQHVQRSCCGSSHLVLGRGLRPAGREGKELGQEQPCCGRWQGARTGSPGSCCPDAPCPGGCTACPQVHSDSSHRRQVPARWLVHLSGPGFTKHVSSPGGRGLPRSHSVYTHGSPLSPALPGGPSHFPTGPSCGRLLPCLSAAPSSGHRALRLWLLPQAGPAPTQCPPCSLVQGPSPGCCPQMPCAHGTPEPGGGVGLGDQSSKEMGQENAWGRSRGSESPTLWLQAQEGRSGGPGPGRGGQRERGRGRTQERTRGAGRGALTPLLPLLPWPREHCSRGRNTPPTLDTCTTERWHDRTEMLVQTGSRHSEHQPPAAY